MSAAVRRVVEVDPQTDPRWLNFITAHQDGSIYHHPRWLRVIESAYGHTFLGLACENDDGQLRGILPLFHKRGVLSGRRLISLPHTPVAGPIADDEETLAALLKSAIERALQSDAQLELKSEFAELNILVNAVIKVPWQATYILNLPKQPVQLRFGNSRNHARIQWSVSRAAKLGVRVRPADAELDLRAWYELYLETMRWHGVPPRPYRFFDVAWHLLRPCGLMQLLLAEQPRAGRAKLLAGSIFLMFGHTVFYAFNGRSRTDLSLRPNDSIQWQAVRGAWQGGFRRFDFGEVEETNQGLAEFKAKWGAEPKQLYRYFYPAAPERQTSIFASGRYARRVATAAWRYVPLKFTEVMGERIYRHL